MTDLCNIPEHFFREVRYLLVYEASVLSFADNFKGKSPKTDAYILKTRLNPYGFSRNITMKTENWNDYFDVKIQFSFYDLTPENRQKWYDFHKKRNYVVVIASNAEMLVLGNDREPFSLWVDDQILDNASGKDTFEISLTGQSIITPKIAKISEPFRVLLFIPPMK